MLRGTQHFTKINLFGTIIRNKLVLTSLYHLSHQVGFRDDFVTHIYGSPHFANAPAAKIEQFHFKNHSVSRNHFMLEFTVVDLEKIGVILSRGQRIDTKNAARLCKGFYLQHAWHNRVVWKMTDEEGLVECDIFYADNMPVSKLDDLIHQQERR